MSFMEVDIPTPVASGVNGRSNGTASSASPTTTTVQFNAVTEVNMYPMLSLAQGAGGGEARRPKHKSRRRARIPPKINMPGDGVTANGECSSPLLQQVGKPLSPSKLKKLSDKDRHSRTGRRGMPKKGRTTFYIIFLC